MNRGTLSTVDRLGAQVPETLLFILLLIGMTSGL
jgi:hypothetical protein